MVLIYFQKTCHHLKYCDNPVLSAPSGLALGGGEEIILQSNSIIKKNKKFSILICLKTMINYYKKYNWQKISKNHVLFKDLIGKLSQMVSSVFSQQYLPLH